jgi:hypothetical protein
VLGDQPERGLIPRKIHDAVVLMYTATTLAIALLLIAQQISPLGRLTWPA